jgi:hypothetical protein
LYVHLKTEGNKTVSAEKVFRDDVLLCAWASRPTFL